MRKVIYVITEDDAAKYRISLIAVRVRMRKAYSNTNDQSYKNWFARHDPMIADLITELS